MKGTTGASPPASSAILTVPNVISLARVGMIPVFVWLIVRPETTTEGLIVFGLVMATDWVDGVVARRTAQISEIGRILDPVADRLAIAAGLIALMVRGVVPTWAGWLILARDAAVLGVGGLALLRRGVRVDVRFIGKSATASLMFAIPAIAWGNLGLPLADAALALGWLAFWAGAVESYVAAVVYLRDLQAARG